MHLFVRPWNIQNPSVSNTPSDKARHLRQMRPILQTSLLFMLLSTAASAQESIVAGSREKSVTIARTETAPIIDGRLDDPAWRNAATVDDFHQLQPIEYAEASEYTVVYLTYTDTALYVGAMLYDSEPDQITARIMRQGELLWPDDYFSVTIDTFHNRRSGYRFLTNPNGVRQEGLYANVTDQQWDWQGIWRTASTRTDDGWMTEIEIPFRTISFDPTGDTWGINFRRSVARRDERIAWVSRNRTTNPSVAGIAVGFEGLQQGVGLDIVSSAAAGNSRTVESPTGAGPDMTVNDSRFDPSLDVFYKLTPSLTGSLTVNTDFSATEVDDRQVNLTRFGLFFPEKRDFFLQDADIFEFGNIDRNGRPFFSRRIGLSRSGNPVDLEVGGKISGRIGRFNIGALSIRQGEDEAVSAGTATVARVSANILQESFVGVIATEGDPRSNADNSVAGADFFYRNTRLPGGKVFETNVWYQQSDTPGITDDDKAYGFRVSSPNNEGWRLGLVHNHIEDNFNPALGFVNRRGIEQWNYTARYILRPEDNLLRYVRSGFFGQQFHNIATGELESRQLRLEFAELESISGDELQLHHTLRTEVLTEGFELSDGVIGGVQVTDPIVIPTGSYDFDETRIQISGASQRRISGELSIQTGEFYNGSRDSVEVEVAWRPSGRFFTSLSYEYNDIEVQDVEDRLRRFESRLVSYRTEIAFNATLSWATLIQYDNLSETIGINSRVQWIPQAGREAFLVFNHNLQDFDRDNHFDTAFSDTTVKFSYTFRF